MDEGNGVSLWVQNAKMLCGVGIFFQQAWLETACQKVVSHVRYVFGCESNFSKPVLVGSSSYVPRRQFQEKTLVRRAYQKTGLGPEIVWTTKGQPQNMFIKVEGFFDVGDVDRNVIDAGDAGPLRLLVSGRGEQCRLQCETEQEGTDGRYRG